MAMAWPDSPAYSDLQPQPDPPAPAPPAAQFDPAVERWRPLVAKYFAPADVSKALYVIQHESGGDPSIPNSDAAQNGASPGLFQITATNAKAAGIDGTDPEQAVKWAATQVANHGWSDWGEGTSYQGRNFGALGQANPYGPGGTGAAGPGGAAIGQIKSDIASLKQPYVAPQDLTAGASSQAPTPAILGALDNANYSQPATDASAGNGSDIQPFGVREDGTPKGNGFFGPLGRSDGGVSTELSVGVNIDGREMEHPSLVPTLNEDEKNWLLTHNVNDANDIPPTIIQKATDFASQRIKAGKSPFAAPDESPQGRASIPNAATVGALTAAGYSQPTVGATATAGPEAPTIETPDYSAAPPGSLRYQLEQSRQGQSQYGGIPGATLGAVGNVEQSSNIPVVSPFIRNTVQPVAAGSLGVMFPATGLLKSATGVDLPKLAAGQIPSTGIDLALAGVPAAREAGDVAQAGVSAALHSEPAQRGAMALAGRALESDSPLAGRIARGALDVTGAPVPIAGAAQEPLQSVIKTAQNRSLSDLRTIAEDRGIDTTGATSKADIVQRLQTAAASETGSAPAVSGIASTPAESAPVPFNPATDEPTTIDELRQKLLHQLSGGAITPEQLSPEETARQVQEGLKPASALPQPDLTDKLQQSIDALKSAAASGQITPEHAAEETKILEQVQTRTAPTKPLVGQPPPSQPGPDLFGAAQGERQAAITEFGTQGQNESEMQAGARARAYGLPPQPETRVPFPTAPENEPQGAWPGLLEGVQGERQAAINEYGTQGQNEADLQAAAKARAYGAPPPPPPPPPQGLGAPRSEFPPDYHGVQPQLLGNEDHNAIIDAFQKALQGKASELTSNGALRSVTSRIGGDLQDPYLSAVVNSESALKHELIQNSVKDLPPLDIRGLDPEAANAQLEGLTSKLESIEKEADQGVSKFRNDALDARYGNTEARSIAHGTLAANDEALANQKPNLFDKSQGVLKEMVLGADLGVTLRHGLTTARSGTTSLLSSAIGHGLESIATALGKDPEALGLYPNDAISHSAQQAADGLINRGAEAVGIQRGELTDSSVQRGVAGSLKNKFLPEGENPVASAVKAPFRAGGAVAHTITDVQFGALNKVRQQIYEGRLYQAKLLGQDISEGSQARRAAADFANFSTSTARTASDAGRALAEKRILLTPQMTRAQFAELAQPLKTFNNPSQALNTANQLLSTTAMLGTAYALNQQFGVTKGVSNFISNSANPDSSNFGKIVLNARDPQGNHLVWNFMPQFSTGSAILKSIRATQALATGSSDAKHSLDLVGSALGSYGVGRLNQGLSDLSRLGGFGYDQNGKFHWGDMSNNQRALGVAPVPLTAQTTLLQGKTDAVSVGANALGGQVYGESVGQLRNRLAVEKGYPDYVSAPPAMQNAIKQNPDLIKAMAAAPTPFQAASSADLASSKAEVDRQEALHEQGQNVQKLSDVYHDEGQRNRQAATDLGNQFATQFAGFNKTAYDKAVEGYYSPDLEKTIPEGQNGAGDPDFDATAAAKQDYLDKLPADQKDWVTQALGVAQSNKTDLQKQYDIYIAAKKQAGYFDIAPTDPQANEKKVALDKQYPELDVQSWRFNATKGAGGSDLNSTQAVDRALADPLSKNTTVKLAGLSRPINQDDNSLAAWKYSQKPILWYDEGLIKDNAAAEGKTLAENTGDKAYLQPFAQMDTKHKAEITGRLHTAAQESSPELDAWLYYWGASKTLQTQEASDIVSAIFKKYGNRDPKAPMKVQ